MFFIALTLFYSFFLVFPGMWNIALNGAKIESDEKVNIIGELLELFAGTLKGKNINSLILTFLSVFPGKSILSRFLVHS